ncbi:MAG: hypothetical protein Q9226_006269 [Calogaya cf. arnoldii]
MASTDHDKGLGRIDRQAERKHHENLRRKDRARRNKPKGSKPHGNNTMTSAEHNNALARHNTQAEPHASDDDVAAQRAAIDRHRAYRNNNNRKQRLKKNAKDKDTPHGNKMCQLRRWMMNEQKKEDKGGMTQPDFYALSAWSRQPEVGGQVTLEPDAEQGKNRFMAEWEAAAEEQGLDMDLEDWWEKVLSYQERTGQPNPDKEYWKIVREEGVIAAKSMGLPADNAIVVDESDDEDGSMAVEKMEGVEKSLNRGISGEMVLRGPRPRLPTVEEERGHQSRSVSPLEPVPRDGSEESGADLDDEGGVTAGWHGGSIHEIEDFQFLVQFRRLKTSIRARGYLLPSGGLRGGTYFLNQSEPIVQARLRQYHKRPVQPLPQSLTSDPAPLHGLNMATDRKERKRATRQKRLREAREALVLRKQPKRHRLVKNKETLEWAGLQARRWLANEQRKMDRGGLTNQGVDDFIEWSWGDDLDDFTAAEQCNNANFAIERFLREGKGALQAQKKDIGAKDWWPSVPALPTYTRSKLAKGKWKRNQDMEGSTFEDAKIWDVGPMVELLGHADYQANPEETVKDSAGELWTAELAFRHASSKEAEEVGEHGGERMKEPKLLSAVLAEVGVGEAHIS